MKNIFEIMKEYGLEVAEDKKKDFEKLVLDNYKTVSDYEKQAEKLKTAEGKVTTLTENLDKFKDVNVDELNNKITTLKADLENKDKELKDKLADRDFNDLLRESIAGANGKNAKAITFAKKQKITYHVKVADKVKKIVCKKKAKAYRYTWNKTKTTVYTCKFYKKWEKTAKEVPTVYNVYGKKTKKGAYELLATTKAKKFTTVCKYVKVMPATEW